MEEVLYNQSLKEYVQDLGKSAKAASILLSSMDSAQKNQALEAIKLGLIMHKNQILLENIKDIEQANKNQFDAAFIDRLTLTNASIDAMIEGVEQIIQLPDPIGELLDIKPRPSGIQVGKMRVALGVIGIIYESRPNVTIDAAALCLKSGNGVILRGGAEAFHTNQALASVIETALRSVAFPEKAVQVINTTDRAAVGFLLELKKYIDVIIPRGGNALVARINAESKIPVIKHLSGVCHTYVAQDADLNMALSICDNAKTQRYAPCNTMETLLIDQSVAAQFLPMIARCYLQKGVEMKVCVQAALIMEQYDLVYQLATEEDWITEYLAPIISIKIVEDMESAIWHINHYGSHHTDVIVSNHHAKAMHFLRSIDSACVMINASSRFTDGFEFGLGAEIGISTDKLHVRGPVGLEGLTSLKYIVLGSGQIRH